MVTDLAIGQNYPSAVYDPDANKIVTAFSDWANSGIGKSVVFQNANSGIT